MHHQAHKHPALAATVETVTTGSASAPRCAQLSRTPSTHGAACTLHQIGSQHSSCRTCTHVSP
eukprot:3126459-Amphidinium_carterae.1